MNKSQEEASPRLKSVVITGGAGGIGLASALRFAREGLNVAVVDKDIARLNECALQVRAHGVECIAIEADVSDFQQAQNHANDLRAHWGQIDVLVNNAAISQAKTLLEISEAEWDRTIDVNLKGYFNWCKAIAPEMVARKTGRIVNISSVSANTGAGPNAASKVAYVTAKAGILGLTRALARELSPSVTVNAICPGAIDTHMTKMHFTPIKQAIEARIPLGRIGTPEDIAEVVFFLGAATPMYITGEIIDVDGGQWIN